MTNARFRRGTPAPLRVAAAPRGTHFRFGLSEPAAVTITLERKVTGRRVGTRCVKPTKANRSRRTCTRLVSAGVLRADGTAGANALAFGGRIGSKSLPLGAYRATIRGIDTAGNASGTRALNLRIVAR